MLYRTLKSDQKALKLVTDRKLTNENLAQYNIYCIEGIFRK